MARAPRVSIAFFVRGAAARDIGVVIAFLVRGVAARSIRVVIADFVRRGMTRFIRVVFAAFVRGVVTRFIRVVFAVFARGAVTRALRVAFTVFAREGMARIAFPTIGLRFAGRAVRRAAFAILPSWSSKRASAVRNIATLRRVFIIPSTLRLRSGTRLPGAPRRIRSVRGAYRSIMSRARFTIP
ncbi:hypothetical protein D7V93_14755 [Corallococcus llansteffanensis]|uniref:Uncharacterized protein n=1 Tax=Corallococcus llansteffanensis TaxID=2316731 RepID=A0A3A8Q0G7_9BACT|nr:hypothetical protein D7V93_14755 [Corallococcus llansteffanensis]